MRAVSRTQTTADIAIQAIFVVLLIALVAGFLFKVQETLQAQHITSGFSFLWRATGWDIGYSFLPYTIRDPYWWTLLTGLVNTIGVGTIGLVFATLLGLVVAAMRVFGNVVISGIAKIYIELIRNIPPLLQLLVWYALFTALPPPRAALQPVSSVFLTARGIFLPGLNIHWLAATVIGIAIVAAFLFSIWLMFSLRLGFTSISKRLMLAATFYIGSMVAVGLSILLGADATQPLVNYPALGGLNIRGGLQLPPELAAIVFSTLCYGSAYAAEIIRSGFISIDPGKVEAGKALGLGGWSIFARIQVPLVAAAIMPMMTNLYIWLMKATTLGIAIGFADLFMISVSAINQSGQTIEILVIVALAFWAMNSLLVLVMSRAASLLKYWS